MEISGIGLLHFYQQASSSMGNQTDHRTNTLLPYVSNCLYESAYECKGLSSRRGKIGPVKSYFRNV